VREAGSRWLQHPTEVAHIAEQHGEPEAAVAAPLAGDQIEVVPAEGVMADDLPLVVRRGQQPRPLLIRQKLPPRHLVLSTRREKPAIADHPVSAKRSFPAHAKVSETPD